MSGQSLLRCLPAGAWLPARLSAAPRLCCGLLLGFVLAAAAVAQAAAPPAAATPVYGKVTAPTVRLQCWPAQVAEPPVFEETLEAGQIVPLGRSENGFRAVLLPLGPQGYVHKRFAATDDDGNAKAKGTKVAFRYRPKTTEAPVAQLNDGAALLVVGEQDDWWKVRVAGIEAWLPEAQLQVLDAADAAAQQMAAQQVAALAERHGAAAQARLAQIAQQKQRAVQDQADLAALQQIEAAFRAQMEQPQASQQFGPVEQALDKFEQELAAESAARPPLAALRERLKAQKWLVEATGLLGNAPSLPTPEPAPPKDELERLQAIGWLRYESRLAAPGLFYIERGGVRQHVVTCSSGRYELALFVNREIGINGPRRRPPGGTLTVLDAERIEVLGAMRR